jgi:DNA polymerase (family 10)
MLPRAAAHALAEIATLLELRGENPHKVRAFSRAARAVQALDVDDIAPAVRTREIAGVRGIGPVTLGVLVDLVETGDAEYLDLLRETTSEGLLEMLRIPGLGPARIHRIHAGLGVETLHDLEAAAADGRLASLPGFGQRTAARILRGIATLREGSPEVLYTLAASQAWHLRDLIARLPGVRGVEVAGSIRRRCEVVRDVDLVVSCDADASELFGRLGDLPGVKRVLGVGSAAVALYFVNGARADVYCVPAERAPLALWRATGGAAHVQAVERRAADRGLALRDDLLLDPSGRRIPVATEPDLYSALGLAFVAPELREHRGELDAAATGALPRLLELADIQGVLHCHSSYSDGTATIEEMARAAQRRGWSYLGITDHSQSSFYAGGVKADAVLRQHEEIDQVNARLSGFRVLKGIEADILADGRVDYGAELLDRFDYVVGSVHSRFGMTESEMTGRILTALEDPHLTILGHPTGRLLLTREPYAVNVEALIERAAELGVAVELNCDPHRLDLDWRWLQAAKARRVPVEIGPDAHSPEGLDNTELGVGVARKGWLERDDVLNTRDVEGVLEFARARRLAPVSARRPDLLDHGTAKGP